MIINLAVSPAQPKRFRFARVNILSLNPEARSTQHRDT